MPSGRRAQTLKRASSVSASGISPASRHRRCAGRRQSSSRFRKVTSGRRHSSPLTAVCAQFFARCHAPMRCARKALASSMASVSNCRVASMRMVLCRQAACGMAGAVGTHSCLSHPELSNSQDEKWRKNLVHSFPALFASPVVLTVIAFRQLLTGAPCRPGSREPSPRKRSRPYGFDPSRWAAAALPGGRRSRVPPCGGAMLTLLRRPC